MNKLGMTNESLAQESARLGALTGLRIKDARIQRGLSQDSMARSLGVSTSHLCNVETGRKKPSFEMILSIAILLDISLDYLLLGRGYMENRADSRVIFRSDAEFEAMAKAEK